MGALLNAIDIFEIRRNAVWHYSQAEEASYTESRRQDFKFLQEDFYEQSVQPTIRDFANITKPYSYKYSGVEEKEAEKFVLWRGLKNIVNSVVGFVALPFLLLRDLARSFTRATSFYNLFQNLGLSVALTLGRALSSLGHLARGIAQLSVLAAFTVIKMRVRAYLASQRDKKDADTVLEKRTYVVSELNEIKHLFNSNELTNGEIHLYITVNRQQHLDCLKKVTGLNVITLQEGQRFGRFLREYEKGRLHVADDYSTQIISPRVAKAAFQYLGLFDKEFLQIAKAIKVEPRLKSSRKTNPQSEVPEVKEDNSIVGQSFLSVSNDDSLSLDLSLNLSETEYKHSAHESAATRGLSGIESTVVGSENSTSHIWESLNESSIAIEPEESSKVSLDQVAATVWPFANSLKDKTSQFAENDKEIIHNGTTQKGERDVGFVV